MSERARHLLQYLALRICYCVFQALPFEMCVWFAEFLATLGTTVIKLRRRVVEENLALAFPHATPERRREMAWHMWRHLMLMAFETIRAPRCIHETNWRQHIRLHNGTQLCRILLDSRPTLIVSAHFGNFELGGAFLGMLGFPTYAVARPLDNPYVGKFIDRLRNAGRQHTVPKKGGYDQILDVLAGGGTMVFLADQYAGTKGCWVEFFGRPASAHKAIALLSLDKDARIVVCGCRRLPGEMQFGMSVHSVFDPRNPEGHGDDVKQLTQWYTSELEEVIRQQPEQYWWVHRRWKDTRIPRRKKSEALRAAA
ncbi:MAG TPA: lysophospholipid acyltransferase family protein [Pirellulales bacterium]|nr:lysophospholipid acyltransferase family protein [Pirellulales bacterium]